MARAATCTSWWLTVARQTRSRPSRRRRCARLVQAIRTLGEKERVVTTFYYYDGLTLKEIGGAMNLTEGRISQILHRALAKLREALEGSPEPTGRL
jgi:RNA polymerase sigma factor FliA